MRAGWVCSLRISCRGPVCGQVWNLRKKRQDTEGITAAPPPEDQSARACGILISQRGLSSFFLAFSILLCVCV